MDTHFITHININHVRHLQHIDIPLAENTRKHVMITGKNGSGKTSVIEALKNYMERYSDADLRQMVFSGALRVGYSKEIEDFGLTLCIKNEESLKQDVSEGRFIIAYYADEREYMVDNESHIEKVKFQQHYAIKEHPGKDFVKYLLDMKSTAAMAEVAGKVERANEIKKWFKKFDGILQLIFNNPNVHLAFDIESYEFSIIEPGKEPFSFATLSRGYAAILDIVTDLMMRMETHVTKIYNMPGIVLIDEIETHLHIELQKKIMPILTRLFPQIQFIVTTHSPFVLNSIANTVIYDLENNTLVCSDKGLSNVPYEGIIEGYFHASTLSDTLKQKYDRFKILSAKQNFTADDYEEIAKLEEYLDEVPDYLAVDFMADYTRLKLELESRG